MRKPNKFAIVAVCIAVTALAACKVPENVQQNQLNGDNAVENNDQVDISEVKDPTLPAVNVKIESTNDSLTLKDSGVAVYTSQLGRVRLSTAQNGNMEATKKISATMNAASERNRDEGTKLKNNCLAYLEEIEDPSNPIPWAFETSYKEGRNDAKVVSFSESIYMYTGGAHPSTISFSYNFDAQTGEQLILEDVFGATIENDEPLVEFEKIIKRRLSEKYGQEALQQALEYLDIKELEESLAFCVQAQDCWEFTNDGIKITYSTYSIAPYAAGAFEIEISKDELSGEVLKYFN